MQPEPQLCGRAAELEILGQLLENVKSGQSTVLVLRGEAGIGKTSLLRYLIGAAPGFRVIRAVGVESEMELPFAGLHQLCGSMLGRLDVLAEPQRRALSIAFGLASGERPDRFLVALAALSLMAEMPEQKPLLCVLDDAHWLDQASAQVLGFVGRRLLAESIGLVFEARTPVTMPDHLAGLPALQLSGLAEEPARAVLATVTSGPLDESVRARIVAETHGNPLALLELCRGLGTAELAGGFALPDAGDLPKRIEDHYRERIGELPHDAQGLVLLAAAEPVGDLTLILRAARGLGLDIAAINLAAHAGLLDVDAKVRFRHPLVRSAAYRAAGTEDRALDYLAELHIQAGELSQATALLVEGERIDPGIRAATLPYVSLLLAAWRGDAPTAAALTEAVVRGGSERGEGTALTYAAYARAVLGNGLGDYRLAAEAAHSASAVDEVVISPWALYELVEAAARSGQRERATAAAERLSEIAAASATDWACGAAARSRALLSAGRAAENLYREAIERLGRTRMRIHLARARLSYGEWLRRARDNTAVRPGGNRHGISRHDDHSRSGRNAGGSRQRHPRPRGGTLARTRGAGAPAAPVAPSAAAR